MELVKLRIKVSEKELSKEIQALATNPDLAELLEEFKSLRHVYSAGIKEIRAKLEILDDEFKYRYDHNPIHHMEYRLKTAKSILTKARKKNIPLTMKAISSSIKDIAGVRVICNYTDDIYTIANVLINQDDITLLKTKDYIKNPKSNGYRSLHLVVEVPIFLADRKQPVPIEIQIRTIAMDFWASLEHQLKYKSYNNTSIDIQQELLECAQTITSLDAKMENLHNVLKGDGDMYFQEQHLLRNGKTNL